MKNRFAFAFAAIALPVAANAQSIVAPVSAVIDTGGPGFGSINDTFNQSGLSAGYTSGVTNFNTYLAGNPTHTYIYRGYEWFSNSGISDATVTYDFGSPVTLDAMALWNEESGGIGNFWLLASLDMTIFTSLGNFVPTNNPADPLADYGADVFGFGPITTRYLIMEMHGCPQPDATFAGCSIGEVAFRTADSHGVPEPATWAMMILGMGAIGFAMRRQHGAKVRFAF